MGAWIMLKTAAAALVLAVLPVQAPDKVPMKMEVYCTRGACIVPQDQLEALLQSNENAGELLKGCNAPKGSST